MSDLERNLDGEVVRRARELDAAGFLVTVRLEVSAAAVHRLTGVTLKTLRKWRDLGRDPPSSRTIGTVALYKLVDVLRFAEGRSVPCVSADLCSHRRR